MPDDSGKNICRQFLYSNILKKFFVLAIFASLFFIFSPSSASAADRYWIGGTGNWSDTAHWSNADNGSGGFSVPTSADNVYFSAGSFSVDGNVVTLDVVANTNSLDFSGLTKTMTLTNTANNLNVYGSLSLSTKLSTSFTGTSALYFKATTSVNITSNGNTSNWRVIYFDGVGGTWTNQDNWNIGVTVLYLASGTWSTNNFTISNINEFRISGTNAKVLNLSSSLIQLNNGLLWGASNDTSLTVNAGTSIIRVSGGNWFNGATKTFYNVEILSTFNSGGNFGAFTCNNLSVIPESGNANPLISLNANTIVNGNLTLSGYNSDTKRLFIYSSIIGTQRTITVDPEKVTASNVDFRDIKFANAIDLSGISGGSGDAGGNSGITFTTAQPQWFKHTSGAVNWSDSTKWFSDASPRTTPGRVPLPQDDATFDAGSFTGTSTLTVNVPRIGRSLDMSAVNQAVTMTLANDIESYGSFVLGNNITPNIVNSYTTNLMGRTSLFLNLFNKTTRTVNFYSYGGTYSLQSDITAFTNFYIYNGIVQTNSYNITCGYFYSYPGTTLAAQNSTILLNSNGSTAVFFGTLTGSSMVKFTPTSGTNVSQLYGPSTFNKVWFSGTHTGTFDVLGSSSINELIIDPGRKVRFTAGTTQQIGKLTAIGTALNPITISSITGATHTLNFTGTGNVVGDYLNLSYSTATPANKWFASHSTNGGNNSGWIFANLPDAPTGLTPTAGNGQVSLAWTAPADNGTAITDYIVEYKLTTEPTTWSVFADGTSTLATAVVTGLSNRSSYDFRVSAVNAVGQGTASATATTTPADPLDRYWVGGAGNWSDTSHWSTSDGGAGGQAVPTSANNVYFSAGSFSVDGNVVTLDVVANTNSLDFSGLTKTMTLTSSVNSLNVYGNLTEHPTNITFNFTGTANFYSKGSGIYTTNGNVKNFWNKWYIDGAGITITNADDFDVAYNHGQVVIYLVNGKWDTNGKTTKVWDFIVLAGTKELKLGSSSFYAYRMDVQAPTNFTFNYDTSTVYTQYNIFGNLTFYNLTLQKIVATDYVSLSGNINVTNNLVMAGANSTTLRFLIYSNTIGTQRTITVDPAKVTASNVDFRDIKFQNAINLSGISGGSGDAGGNSGITFTTAQPQWFKHTSGAVNWSDSTKWYQDQAKTVLGRVPLPQDDATFDAGSFTGTSTLTVNVPRIGRSLDMSGVNQAVTFNLANNIESYGSFVLGSNITPTGNIYLALMGNGSFNIKTYNKTLYNLGLARGTFTFLSDCTILGSYISRGYSANIDFNDYNTTIPQFVSSGGITTVYMGNGIMTLTNITTATDFSAADNFYAEGSTIKLNPSSGSNNITFAGGSKTFNKVWFSGSHTGNFDISGSNTINELIIDSGRTVRFIAGTTQQIGKFTAIGTALNPITISSITGATHTLNYTGATNVVADYLNLSYSTATPANKWFASHSTNGGNNSGWIFANAPDAPTAVGASGGNALANLTWSAPAYNGGTAITDYIIEYKLTSEPTTWSTFADGTSTNTTGTVTGLVNGSSYDFRISAVNAIGQGTISATATATPITVPNTPTAIVATRGNTQASVAFTAPVFNGGSPITSYTVTSNHGNQVSTGSSSPIVVTGLSNGTEYKFTVTATNAAGTGPASADSNPVTPATVSDAPTTPIAVAGNAQVSLSWTAPIWNGGSPITDYAIEYKLSSEPTVWSLFADGVSTNTHSVVTGLTNAHSYDFRIYSVNDVGQGSSSLETSAMPITVPDAPTAVSGIAGNAQATISFTPPLFDGGSTINNYTVTSNPGGLTATGNLSPITVSGLTNGTQYAFTVVATNSVGSSSPSNPSTTITPVTVPDAPTAIIATEGNKQASIAFTPPAFDGGTPITLYTATSTPGNFTGTSVSSPIVVTSLTNGTTYTFTVKATNAVGTSGESSPSNEVTLSTEPSQPVNLASTVLGSSIGLSWSAPLSNGGSTIIDYVIEYQLTTGGTWAVFAEGLNTSTTATVIGLSNRVSYDFRVIAINTIGQSVPSDTTTATPGEPAQVIIQNFSNLTVPNIIANIRITNEGISNYEYQYTWCLTDSAENLCGGGDDLWSGTAAKLINHGENYDVPLTSTMLIPGNYYFHIKVLYGSNSSNAYQSFTALATYPDTPTSPTAIGGNAQATVSFTPSAFDGGSPITNYTVTSNPGGIIGTGITSPIVVNSLTNGITYNFNVTATNIMGTSPASSYSNQVTPVTIPDAPTGVTGIAGNREVTLSWIAPVNYGGSAITDYIIEYKLSSVADWIIFSDGISTVTTATITGLINNQSYDFRISTVNAVGQSAVNSTNVTLPKNKQGGGSSVSPIEQVVEPVLPQEPSNATTPEISNQETPTREKPTKSPVKDRTNSESTTKNEMPPNEITITPTEKSPTEEGNTGKNKGLGIITKIIIIAGGGIVGGGGIWLLVLMLLRRIKLAKMIKDIEIPPEIPPTPEPRRKI